MGLRNNLMHNFTRYGISFTLIYFGLCLVVAVPIILDVWKILFTNAVPAGGDPADHVLFVMKILATGDPLIEYTQFPNLTNEQNIVQSYYPSFLHILVAIPTYVMKIVGIAPFTATLLSMKAFMFASYLIGIIGYALIIIRFFVDIISVDRKEQQQKFVRSMILVSLAILAFGLFMFSSSPIIKTFRDGGYGEILAMWTVLPFYIYGLMRSRWIIAGILFAVIASTHNISIILTLIITLSYVISLLISGNLRALRNMWKLAVVGSILSIPAIAYFYYPVILSMANQETGLSAASSEWTRSDIAGQIGNFLYYYGMLATLGLLFINYRKSAWLACWIVLYLVPFYFSLFFLERLAREFAIPFGLTSALFTGCIIFLFVTKIYPRIVIKIDRRFGRGISVHQVILCIVLAVTIIPSYYELFSPRFESFSHSMLLDYYSEAMSRSNNYLLNASQNSDGTVILYGINPWLKPYTFGKLSVLEVETPDMEKLLNKADSRINQDLRSILENPNSDQAYETLRKYNVKYIFLSDVLSGRWYSESQYRLIPIFAHFEEVNDQTNIQLEQQWQGDEGELLQIYSVNLGR